MKKLVKKLIVVLKFYGLTGLAKRNKMIAIKDAHVANPTLVPDLKPTTTIVEGKLNDLGDLYQTNASLKEQLSNNIQLIYTAEDELNDIFVSKWATQTQNAANEDPAIPKLLGYGIKGEKDAPPDLSETAPLISDIDINISGQHTLHIINKDNGKKKLPENALRTDVYGQTGGTLPTNLTTLISNGGGYLGEAVKGKFKYALPQGKVGTIEYYIAVYVDKKTKKPASQSKVANAIIS